LLKIYILPPNSVTVGNFQPLVFLEENFLTGKKHSLPSATTSLTQVQLYTEQHYNVRIIPRLFIDHWFHQIQLAALDGRPITKEQEEKVQQNYPLPLISWNQKVLHKITKKRHKQCKKICKNVSSAWTLPQTPLGKLTEALDVVAGFIEGYFTAQGRRQTCLWENPATGLDNIA